nr:LINE-1 reverse transcriptase isogeny [Tanacetum cinerariifolium]
MSAAVYTCDRGLKVSLSKSVLYGINIHQTQLQQYAQLTGCPGGNFPFEYLGVPIGINPRRINAWQKVLGPQAWKWTVELVFRLLSGMTGGSGIPVAAATRMLISLPGDFPSFWARFSWCKHLPAKVQCFLWLALHDAIPVKDVLLHRHVLTAPLENLCVWCNEHVESISHLLLHCH